MSFGSSCLHLAAVHSSTALDPHSSTPALVVDRLVWMPAIRGRAGSNMSSTASDGSAAPYDHQAELRALDATKAGVRGVVASGSTVVPRIFRVPNPIPTTTTDHAAVNLGQGAAAAPSVLVIDIDVRGTADHGAVVAAVRRAAAEWGTFLVTGHGVPPEVASAALRAARAFHDADGGEGSEKARLFSRDPAKNVWYNTNFDFYDSPVANWRDSLYITMEPNPPDPAELPENCRDVFFDYGNHLKRLQETLFGLLSEALGLNESYLSDIGCNQGQMIVCHYYPPCPQPELAIGMVPHSDWGFLTVLLQNEFDGLQVLHNEEWINVVPMPGEFVVSLGDLLQLVSNNKFKSGEHRVLASSVGPRVSIGSYPTHAGSTRIYGPIKELLSHESPALYKETLASDYRKHCTAIGLGNRPIRAFMI